MSLPPIAPAYRAWTSRRRKSKRSYLHSWTGVEGRNTRSIAGPAEPSGSRCGRLSGVRALTDTFVSEIAAPFGSGLLAFQSASAQLAAGQRTILAIVKSSVPTRGGSLQQEEPEALERERLSRLESVDHRAEEWRFAKRQHCIAAVSYNQLRRSFGPKFIAREIVQVARNHNIEAGRNLPMTCFLQGRIQGFPGQLALS
jgi:hypothetical protein